MSVVYMYNRISFCVLLEKMQFCLQHAVNFNKSTKLSSSKKCQISNCGKVQSCFLV